MRFTERQRIVVKANLARDRAETLLHELLATSRAVQIHNVIKSRPAMNCEDSLEKAVSSARRLVVVLNGTLAASEIDLVDEEMSVVDEFSLLDPLEGLVDAEDVELDELLRAEGIGVSVGGDESLTMRGYGFSGDAAVGSDLGVDAVEDDEVAECAVSSGSATASGSASTTSPTAHPAGGGGGGGGGSSGLRSGVGSEG